MGLVFSISNFFMQINGWGFSCSNSALSQFVSVSKNSITHLTLSPPALKVSLFSLLLSLCTNVEESKTKRRWQWQGILLAYEHHNKISKNCSLPVTVHTHRENEFGSILILKLIIVRYALICDNIENIWQSHFWCWRG